MTGYEHIEHTFAPVYDADSLVLILGTLPSVKSRENHFYYGHKQNRTACAGEYYQKLYSNRVASLFCKFSYNLYLWHQMIAVWLKEKRIPYWSGDTPPNMTGDRVWQWKYQILIIVVSAAVAVAVTLIVEIPAARYLLKDRDSHKEEGKQHDRI